jgi:YVTN family beta-propeller protein
MRPSRAVVPLLAVAVALAAWSAGRRLVPGPQPGGATLLPNGWRLTPAGRAVTVGTLPLGLGVLPDGRVLALLSGYSTNGLAVIDPARWAVSDSVPLSAAWLGLAVAPDGSVLAAGGTTNRVWRLREVDEQWQRTDSVVLADSGAALFAGGLALAPDGRYLAVAGNLCDSVFLLDGATLRRLAAARTGSHPYGAIFTPDARSLLVSNWGDSTVSRYRVADGTLRPAGELRVAPRPSALALGHDGRTLYIAHAAADAVSVVDLEDGRVLATVGLALTPRAPHGSGPNALALAPDGGTLYVANADNNAVAVVDLSHEDGPRVAGMIPTGWYPTAVAVSADGRTLYVANGKGGGSAPNPHGPNAPDARPDQYVAALLVGSVTAVPVPDAAALRRYTRQVLANSPYRDALLTRQPWPRRSPIPRSAAERSPIRHVVYVIRENRTYDQVLGDLPRGNGDSSLTIFGDSVTPNAHALASRYVLFDNFYVDGDVSADGHLWTDAAYASDYNEKTWPAIYGGRRTWDLDAGLPVMDPLAGYLWDAARRSGVSVRNYGEMSQWDAMTGRATPSAPGLVGVTDSLYPPFVLSIFDTTRAAEFARELAQYERAGDLPQLMIVWLPRDHTEGRRAGHNTPRAMVADNDLALGRIVEALSHSRFWQETVVFVLEDDAQNGPDHVDAHRSPLLVVGPWVRRGMIDSTFYTTASVLRTIELILGLPPLSQYDAGATPLYDAFTTRSDSAPYTALAARWPLDETNPVRVGRSTLNPRSLSRPDLADEDALNREIWSSVHGAEPMPAPRHGAVMVRRER